MPSKFIMSQAVPRSRGHQPVEMLESRTLLSAGTFDPAFGMGGTAGSATDEYQAITPLPNGKTIAVLNSRDVTGAYDGVYLARLNRDGSLDGSFGKQGMAVVPGATSVDFPAMAVQADGRILISQGIDDT
ncbi:MAG TPA: hypothetical protein VFE47_03915, partial [Tepidisphaeraceae bacterium]|nr:hypothetical protein [Tepidisphaeraceae bacterium]